MTIKNIAKALIFCCFSLVFYSCDKLNNDLSEVIIKIPLKEAIEVADSISNSNQMEIWHEDVITIDMDSIIAANNLMRFNRINISELILSLNEIESSYNDLGFIEEVRLTISDNLEFDNEVTIAKTNQFQPNELEKNLDIITQDISSFIAKHEMFYFRMYGKKRNSIIISDVRLRLNGKIKLFIE